MKSRFYFLLLIGGCWCLGCTPKTEVVQDNDTLLAKAHKQSLYLSDLEGMFPAGSTREDSTLFVNAFVERWVRERLLLHEAELNVPHDVNIDALVRDYRSTLVLHNYEKILIESDLDSTITEAEIQTFYDENKDEYQLKNPIIRCQFLKIPVSAPNIDQVTTWWQSTDENDAIRLMNYCNKNAEIYYLNEKNWSEIDKIAKHLPKGVLTNANVHTQKNYQHKDENYLYILKVLEVVSNNQPLPIGYIENRAKKVILHQRKIKLIEDKKEALYEAEVNRNNVQIFN